MDIQVGNVVGLKFRCTSRHGLEDPAPEMRGVVESIEQRDVSDRAVSILWQQHPDGTDWSIYPMSQLVKLADA
jgi:hypothetical protein